MNTGGDPGRDDYGLPPVDIEIPDDARELARDVLAYHRELRSRRRRRLARRFYGPLTRDGMVLPLLAGCLALTLVAATLLTVFTARQPTVSLRPPRPATGASSGAASSPAPAPDPAAAALVQPTLFAAGQPKPLNSLPGPVLVLALIPPGCRCLARPAAACHRGVAGQDADLPGGRAQRPGDAPSPPTWASGPPRAWRTAGARCPRRTRWRR